MPIADRCAIPASLHPPQAALRRRCPTRSACLGFTHCHYEKQRHCKCSSAVFGRGRRTWSPLRSGRLVACVPPARTRPSARGFGVDVGRNQGKKKWRSRGVCQGEEGSCGAELVLKAGAGKNIARTLREEKSDIGKPIVRAWGKHRGPNRRRFCRQREKSLRVALCAVFGAG